MVIRDRPLNHLMVDMKQPGLSSTREAQHSSKLVITLVCMQYGAVGIAGGVRLESTLFAITDQLALVRMQN